MQESPSFSIRPQSICSSNQENLIGKRTTLVGYGCLKIKRQFGIGIKRFGHSWIESMKGVLVTTNARKTGGLSCPEDSGAPYLLNQDDQSLCVASINFYSDRRKKNFSTSLFHSEVRVWLAQVAQENNLSLCGLNSECTSQSIPAIFN